MAAGPAHVLWFEECDASSTAMVGGKCASLGEMVKAGIAVPPGFAVTTGAYEEFLERSGAAGIISELVAGVQFDDLHSVRTASEAIESAVVSAGLPEDVEQAVRAAYDDLSARAGTSEVPVAVRSSATTEDLASASFAGQLDTFLWVLGQDEVARHILRCWAGLYSPNALTYRERLGTSGENPLMSVGVQQMVDARAAGVVFTLNPVSGDRSKIALEAVWGLGEGVVSGTVDPDRYLVDKVTLEILSRTVSVKENEYRLDPETSTVIDGSRPGETAGGRVPRRRRSARARGHREGDRAPLRAPAGHRMGDQRRDRSRSDLRPPGASRDSLESTRGVDDGHRSQEQCCRVRSRRPPRASRRRKERS